MDKLIYWFQLLIYRIRLAKYNIHVGIQETINRWMAEQRVESEYLNGVDPEIAVAIEMMMGVEGHKRRRDALEKLEQIYDDTGAGEAAAWIGYCYYRELDQPTVALGWYKKACDVGASWANYTVGSFLDRYEFDAAELAYFDINGTSEDYYLEAANNGHLTAKVRLAELRTKRTSFGRTKMWLIKLRMLPEVFRGGPIKSTDPRVRRD